jgi:uncharacterized protein
MSSFDSTSTLAANSATQDAAHIEQITRAWVARIVIGLNLCPFAAAAAGRDAQSPRLRVRITLTDDLDTLMDQLADEMQRLAETPAHELETTLLVHPNMFGDFEAYNDFLDLADAELEAQQLDGTLQIASFHPHYCFADVAPSDISNATNQSPYPMLHLLREASVEAAVESHPDVDAIPAANINTLRGLGVAGLAELLQK